MQTSNPLPEKKPSVSYSMTLGAMAGQVGCLTFVIVLAALFGGLWLDKQFGTRPFITIGLMIASIPVTLVVMFWAVRKATARLQSSQLPKAGQKLEGDQQ